MLDSKTGLLYSEILLGPGGNSTTGGDL
jgi:hypothetical protein